MSALATALSHLGVLFMRACARMPLPLVRGIGAALGVALHLAVPSRKRVALVNLSFYLHSLPKQEQQSKQILGQCRDIFKYFAQAWLDRGWLWHASTETLAKRLRIVGDEAGLALLRSDRPLVMFAPHFVGLDAGWTALTCPQVNPSPRTWATIYTDQSNKVVDAWIFEGRQRFARGSLHGRATGVKPIAAALKQGGALYLLPDMDFGADGAAFVSFFGEPAATVTSLGRFAKLGKAQVLSVACRMTDAGYDIEVSAPWPQFPSDDLEADALRMNQELEALIQQNPLQYWWLHKRYKTQPDGHKAPY